MTTKLIKKTIEETTENEILKKDVISLDTAIMNEEQEIGRINTTKWGGNHNLNTIVQDVEGLNEAIVTAIINFLNK